jgi:hypothetical protein
MPSAKLDLAEDGLGKNPSARPDIGRCTFSCKTRHEKPQKKWNFTEHLKQRNKKYEQQSIAFKRTRRQMEHFQPTL